MKIKKIAGKIINKDDAIMYIFNGCNGEVLLKLIPAEYEVLLNKYNEIMMERNKPKDLPGQLTFFDDIKT